MPRNYVSATKFSFPCPVCGEPLEKRNKNTGSVPFYLCNNPECLVIEIHAHRDRLTGKPTILRVKTDAIASNRQRGVADFRNSFLSAQNHASAAGSFYQSHAKSSRKADRR